MPRTNRTAKGRKPEGGRGHRRRTKPETDTKTEPRSTSLPSRSSGREEERQQRGGTLKGFRIPKLKPETEANTTNNTTTNTTTNTTDDNTTENKMTVEELQAKYAPSIPVEMVRRWYEGKRCLCCGSEDHVAAACEANPNPPKHACKGSKRAAKRPRGGPAGSGSSSGLTPESKRQNNTACVADDPAAATPARDALKGKRGKGVKKQHKNPTDKDKPAGMSESEGNNDNKKPRTYLYAEVVAGAVKVVITNNDLSHISKKEFQAIQATLDKVMIEELEKGFQLPDREVILLTDYGHH